MPVSYTHLDVYKRQPVTRPSLSESFRTRMLYSCLVDADYLDTEQFMQGDMPRGTGDSLETLLTRLQARLNKWDNPTSELNKLRQQILRACVSAAANPKGIYTLTVPTGGGKTTSSLAFALHHAVEHLSLIHIFLRKTNGLHPK